MEQTHLNVNINAFVRHVKQSLKGNTDVINFWIDLFCGAGGTSTGIQFAQANSFVAACVNHDVKAIESHEANHPHTIHFREDIRDFEVVKQLKVIVDRLRKEFPGCFVSIWASLECTNFSKAKGGMPRDADSRTLAEHMFMYLEQIDPDYFWVENVREFMSWGPLDDKGKPVSRNAGQDYLRWVDNIKKVGYTFDWKLFNAADFGAYQSRERLFLQFAKKGLPVTWPEPTHAKKAKKSKDNDLFSGAQKQAAWKAVREVLDLMDVGVSIFNRPKPLSENTLKRIYAGLIKFVAKGDTSFLKKYFSGSPNDKCISVSEPAGTITCKDHHALVQTEPFTMQYNSGSDEHRVKSLDEPVGTITTGNSHAIVQPEPFIVQRNNGEPSSKLVDVDGPARTLTATAGNQDLVNVQYLNTYYGNGGQHDLDNPAPTVTTKDRITKVNVQFIDQQYGKSKPSDIDAPCGSLTANPKYNLVSTDQFIMNQYSGGGQTTDIDGPCSSVLNVPKQNLISPEPRVMSTNFSNVGRSIDEPCPTITANRKHHYLINANSSTCPPSDLEGPAPSVTSRTHLIVNPSWGGNPSGIDVPCVTIIARQDKSPLYLVSTESGDMMIPVYDTDSETMIKIKEFMIAYRIKDIKMRMLKIPELLRIQGFPSDYQLKGTKTDQKKFIGNAVEVTQAKVLADAHYKALVRYVREKKKLQTQTP